MTRTIRESEKLTAYEILIDVIENGMVTIEAPQPALELLQRSVLRLSKDLENHIGGELRTSMVEPGKMLVSFEKSKFRALPAVGRVQERGPRKSVFSTEVEAHLIDLYRSDVPEGHDKWSFRLLAKKMMELGYVKSISHEWVRQILRSHTWSGGEVDETEEVEVAGV